MKNLMYTIPEYSDENLLRDYRFLQRDIKSGCLDQPTGAWLVGTWKPYYILETYGEVNVRW